MDLSCLDAMLLEDAPLARKPCRTGTKDSCSTTASQLTLCPRFGDLEEDSDNDFESFSSGSCVGSLGTPSTNTSGGLYAEPQQALLFVDWDDTLFPTTELFENWGLPAKAKAWKEIKFTQAQENGLARWRLALNDYLRTARALCEGCVIVSNAKRPWIEDCVSFFAPHLEPLLFGDRGSGIRVVYAREAFASQSSKFELRDSLVPARQCQDDGEEEYSSLLKAWKYAAMRREADRFYSQYPGQTWKNILSQGDMFYEYHAVQDLAFRRCGPSGERLRTKAIMTPARPSIDSLTWEIRTWQLLLPVLVCFDGDVDLDLGSLPVGKCPRVVSEALGMPSLEGMMPASIAAGEEEAVLMLDELAQAVQRHLLDG